MDTTSKEDSGNVRFEDISSTDKSLNRNKNRGTSDRVQDQSKPSSTGSGTTKDIGNPVFKPSDRNPDITESGSGSKSHNENRGAFGVFEDHHEQLPAGKESKSTIQKQTDSILDIRDRSMGSDKVLDSDPQKSKEVDVFQRPLISNNPKFPVQIETDYIKNPEGKACITSYGCYEKNSDEKLSINPEGLDPKVDHYEEEDNLKTGQGYLQPASAQSDCRSNILPSNIQDSRRANQSMAVHFNESTGLEKSSNPSTKNFEDRNIFEAGGEDSLNPRLKQPSGTFKTGGERIEYLPDEPPEPQVISPTVSTESETLVSFMVRLRLINLLFKRCCERMWKTFENQFSKAPFFYLISVIVILMSGLVLTSKKEDADICICIIITLVICILITIVVDKGQWSKTIEKIGETSIFGLFDDDTLGCACCRNSEPEIERHSQYNRLEEDMDTAFEHEVADVSNIDPSDCPQMRMVEQHETLDPGSPDYPPDISEVNVDVHVPGSKRNYEEESGTISKHHGQSVFKKSTKTYLKNKSKKSSASLKLPKSVKVDIQFPETVVSSRDLSSSKPRLQAVASGLAELSQVINASKDKLKLFYEFSPQLTRVDSVEATDLETNLDEFICEHTGHGIACSCSVNVPEKTDESKKEFKVVAGKSSLQPKTDHSEVPKRTTKITDSEGNSSDNKNTESGSSQKRLA